VSNFPPTEPVREFTLAPFAYSDVRRLAEELDLAEPVAVALVRRGYRTPAAAREFLAADATHDPLEFEGMEAAVGEIRAAVARGARITVHGDYDVDGVTATTILVGALRELGAECDWLIPGRLEDGYGLTPETVDRLVERGTGLLITVDCGITSVAEIAAARAAGIAVVVTDHHQPAEQLPDCVIVHPQISGYPCPDLCAAAVAHKVCAALMGAERADRDLDLVALATVADMVPLLGENRTLVRRGLELARRGRRLGLRALMAAASIVPERLTEEDLGFRLAPRINASGRLYRADAAVELLLSDDHDRATRIADELDRANHERRQTEREVLADAERQLREMGDEGTEAPAIVLWGEGWHPGVVGICASRLAERRLKPAVLIALDERGRGKGSGRSVPGFDLLEGLRACASTLAKFGGHRAAAGLEIEAGDLESFRAAFCAHVASAMQGGAAVRAEAVDAVVGGESLGHRAAEQLLALGPFGKGNPPVRLLVPGARLADVRPMGEGERHARFTLRSGTATASGVAFGVNGSLEGIGTSAVDASVRLELNEWNGAVTPRVVLSEIYTPRALASADWLCEQDEHDERLAAELERDPGMVRPLASELGAARRHVDHSGASAVAAVAALASSGEPTLVICADAFWRRDLVERAAPPARFGGGEVAILAARGSHRAGVDATRRVLSGDRGGVVLADWPALALQPELAREFDHVVLADPAPDARLEALALAGPAGRPGYLHTLALHLDPELATRALELLLPGRPALGAAYRSLRESAGDGVLDKRGIRTALCGDPAAARAPEWCARTLRILAEVGVVRLAGNGRDLSLEVVSSVRGELESSGSYVAQTRAHEECVRFLTAAKKQSSSPLPAAA